MLRPITPLPRSGCEGGNADDGRGWWVPREAAEELLVGKVEDAAIGSDHEVAVAVRDQAIDRSLRWVAPIEPRNGAPNGKTPPSDATSQ